MRSEIPSASAPRPTPLGLPRGSVRALLTLMIVAIVCIQVARGDPLDLLWTETLAIALAHYFTTRRFVDLPPELVHRLQAEGVLPDEPAPLFLPGHSVRGLIILAFLGLALYLQRGGRLQESQALSVLALVGVYLLGVVFNSLRRLINRNDRSSRPRRLWDNLKAVATLTVLVVTLLAVLLDRGDVLPPNWREVTLGLVLFYFGSR